MRINPFSQINGGYMFFLLPFIASALGTAATATTAVVSAIPIVGASVAGGITAASTAVGTAVVSASTSAGLASATSAALGSIAASTTTITAGEGSRRIAKEVLD